VVQAVLASNLTVPAGTARIGGTEYDVTVNNSPPSVAEFNRLPVKVVNGAPILLGDVAKVHDGFAQQQNIVRVNGQRSTYLVILKKAGASTLAVVDAAKELVPVIQATAPGGMEVKLDFDQSVFVRAAVDGVVREGVIAAVLVSLMILIFLGSWRSVVIVSTSIPLAITVALIALFLLGQSLNIMTLGGLALAIGMLVDDATVAIENIHRNQGLGKPLTIAILDGSAEVATPALAATLVICIVFFPVVLLVGPAKYLFASLALSVVFSMLASYVLSRTLVPALAHKLGSGEAHGAHERAFDRLFEGFRGAYTRVLAAALERRGYVLVVATLLVVGGAALATVVGLDFFPEVDAGQMRLHVRAPIGTRIEDTEALVAAVEHEIRAVIPADEVATINDNIGVPQFYNLAFVGTDSIGSQDAEVLIALRPEHHPTRAYLRAIRARLPARFPGTTFYFQSADIVSQVLSFGLSAPVDIEIEGANFDKTTELARTLRDRVRLIPGVVDVRIPQVLSHPALAVTVDRERAAQVGLSQRDVAQNLLVSLSSSSLVSPSFWLSPENNVNYLVVAQTPLAKAASVDDLLHTPISSPAPRADGPAFTAVGTAVAPSLAAIAHVAPGSTKAMISHDNVQRVLDVQLNVDGRDLGAVAADIDDAIAALGPLPPGAKVRVRGQSEAMLSSFKSLGLGLILAAVLVYLLLVVLFQSFLDPFIIIIAVPGALVGVLVMLGLTGTTLNVESLMGTIMAVGVAVSNSILLVSFANDVREVDEMGPVRAALEAGRTRLRPVLMTALAMILGMVPMALGFGEGGEQNAPLARAVIGGLAVATVVTLLVVPVVYSLVRRARPARGRLDEQFAAETVGAKGLD
jgi:multidrug efflux pump subunit AcrB